MEKTKTNPTKASEWLNNADILTEALPFMQKYAGLTIVIKYGGNAMSESSSIQSFCEDVALLKQSGLHPVIVHGGGPQIGLMLEKMGIETRFEGGMRITDKKTLEVVELVLCNKVNKEIVTKINKAGGKAVGISGKDSSIITAKKYKWENEESDSKETKTIDLGFVGIPISINSEMINDLIKNDFVPVIAPLGISEEGITYNINADTAAGAIAESLKAKRLLILTDVQGVLNSENNLIEEIEKKEVESMINVGVVSGGMIPKLNTCIHALEKGVGATVIVDGRNKHAVLLELFTEHGAGTLIR
ncbi:MAG: acetylglutamate kinase [Pseudomonadota bacterium]|nr:acetylglutamate kinase [Pseudomonadota bacterium]MEE3294829.1 acetylglutamate kinase [Pseudomonadota bacterium]